MRKVGLIAAALLGVAGSAIAADQPAGTLAHQTVTAVCQKCHCDTGDSDGPIYPRLNGQQADYIAAQLKNFRDRKRDDTHARGYMWGNARTIDDKAMRELGRYFAGQKPTAPQTGGALAAEGEAIYAHGDPAKGIGACQQCHGKNGEGSGVVPRIAGQHAAYFRKVMGAFRTDLRHHDQMAATVKNLSDHQVEALSSFLSND